MGLYNFSPLKSIHNLEIHMKGINVLLANKRMPPTPRSLMGYDVPYCLQPSPVSRRTKNSSPKTPSHSIQTIAATMAPMTQYPAFSTTIFLVAALVLAPLLVLLSVSVPFGNVPLITIVFVPFTTPTCTKLLFSAAILPFPISSPKYVLLSLLSHPHALYC